MKRNVDFHSECGGLRRFPHRKKSRGGDLDEISLDLRQPDPYRSLSHSEKPKMSVLVGWLAHFDGPPTLRGKRQQVATEMTGACHPVKPVIYMDH